MKYYFGIDIGGTFIKAGIIDSFNNLIHTTKVETKKIIDEMTIAEGIMSIINTLLEETNLHIDEFEGIGIASFGLIDSKNGIMLCSNYINAKNYPIVEELHKFTTLPVKIANDADVATLAEQKIGAGVGYNNFIMLTLGTGIGGGIVLNGKNLGIDFNYPIEIGHIKVTDAPLKCHCGGTGCYELIGSTKALINQTKQAMSKNPSSQIWKKYNLSNVSGKTVFEFPKDTTAKEILKQYIKNVGSGIINLVNIFKPELVIIGGGISNQKDNLIVPLENYVNKHIFLKVLGYNVKIVEAKLTNDAGILGTRFLF